MVGDPFGWASSWVCCTLGISAGIPSLITEVPTLLSPSRFPKPQQWQAHRWHRPSCRHRIPRCRNRQCGQVSGHLGPGAARSLLPDDSLCRVKAQHALVRLGRKKARVTVISDHRLTPITALVRASSISTNQRHQVHGAGIVDKHVKPTAHHLARWKASASAHPKLPSEHPITSTVRFRSMILEAAQMGGYW